MNMYATLQKGARNDCHGLHGGRDSNRGRRLTSQRRRPLVHNASPIADSYKLIRYNSHGCRS